MPWNVLKRMPWTHLMLETGHRSSGWHQGAASCFRCHLQRPQRRRWAEQPLLRCFVDSEVWNPYVERVPIFRLKGHTHALCGVSIVPNTPQVLSADAPWRLRLCIWAPGGWHLPLVGYEELPVRRELLFVFLGSAEVQSFGGNESWPEPVRKAVRQMGPNWALEV